MKFKFGFYFLMVFTLILTSCGKDDDCDETSLSSVIVGEWNLNALGSNMGSAEFRSDGTLVDEDDILISGEINGIVLEDKTYTISGDSLITLRVATGSNALTAELPVTSFDCNEIQSSVAGIDVSFNR